MSRSTGDRTSGDPIRHESGALKRGGVSRNQRVHPRHHDRRHLSSSTPRPDRSVRASEVPRRREGAPEPSDLDHHLRGIDGDPHDARSPAPRGVGVRRWLDPRRLAFRRWSGVQLGVNSTTYYPVCRSGADRTEESDPCRSILGGEVVHGQARATNIGTPTVAQRNATMKPQSAVSLEFPAASLR